MVTAMEDADMYDMKVTEQHVDDLQIKMKAREVDVFYGDTHAIQKVDVDILGQDRHRLHRSVRFVASRRSCAASTV